MKIRERDDNTYLYFQEKDGTTIFLGKIDEITKYPSRTIKAYDEISKKYSKYLEDTIKLISILPPQERVKYVSKLRHDLKIKDSYLSSLSPSAAKQYKPKGLTKAEEGTRLRPQEKILKYLSDILENYYSLHKGKPFHDDLVKESVSKIFPKLYRLNGSRGFPRSNTNSSDLFVICSTYIGFYNLINLNS